MDPSNQSRPATDPAVLKAAEEHAAMFSTLQSEFSSQLARLRKEVADKFPKLSAEEKTAALVNAWHQVMQIDAAASSSSEQVVKKKPVRVYIDGCFDIMHSGHYNAVRQAKMLADVLVVGVHSDEEIERNKGPPVMNNAERLATVEACKWVDEVVFDTPYDPSLELLDRLNCDFCVHGDDTSTTADGQDAYAKVKRAGRMKIIKRTEGISTTDLVGRLLLLTKSHHLADDPSLSPSPQQITTSSSPHLAGHAGAPAVPQLSLNDPAISLPPAVAPSAARRVSSDDSKHYASGVSNFLPTTWRISQFSNGRIPKPDDKVVYIDGAFDLFHIGHIQTLKKARALGTFLYVGIHDDKTINQHRGRNYPIMNLHERVMNVLSCKYVDEVVIGAPWEVTKDLIKVLNLSVVVSGTNTKLDPLRFTDETDPYKAAKEMGVYQEVEMSNSLCTDDVIQRIIENRLKYEKRNSTRSKKELAYIDKRTFVPEISNRDNAPAS